MKFTKRLVKLYADASIHVSLAVTCLSILTFLKWNLPIDINLCLVAFLATVVSYNFMKFGTKAKSYFIVKTRYLKIIQIISFLCFLLMCMVVYQLSLRVLVVMGVSGILTTLYALPLLPGRVSFRSLHGLKIYMVAFCWALITVIIPIVDEDINDLITLKVLIEFVQRFLLVLILIIPFDIRDLKNDSISLGTLPQQLGVRKAKQVGYGLLLLFAVLSFVSAEITIVAKMVNTIIALVTFLSLYFARKKQPWYYCSILVEAIPIVWLVLYYLMAISF